MNADERGRNLAEARHFAAAAKTRRPAHGGRPDPRCVCAGTGAVYMEDAIHPCPECVRAGVVSLPRVPDPRGPAHVDWEALAGRALADLQATTNELNRLRREMPVDRMREYDRRYHGGN